MARPLKDGLDYFPLDVDIDNDDKFQMIEGKYGNDGFTVIIKTIMWIYANSYYRYYGENEGLLLIKRVNVDINRVNAIINDAIEWGIFDKKLFSKYKILTSNGIQKRYWGAVERRINVKIIREYWIYEPDRVLVSANINLINVSNKGKSKVDQSKVDQSIYITVQNLSMTEIEYNKLTELYGKDVTDEKIEYARNYKKLNEKYIDLYRTLNNWLKADKGKKGVDDW